MTTIQDAETRLAAARNRASHLERARRETSEAMVKFLSSLSTAIEATYARLPECVAEIKQARSQKKRGEAAPDLEDKLWDELKVKTFARLVLAILEVNLLHLVLQTQIHILGRSYDATVPLSMEVRAKFLTLTYTHLLGVGLKAMAAELETVSAEVLAGTGLSTKLDCSECTALLVRIRERFEEREAPAAAAVGCSPLARFVVAPSQCLEGASPEAQAMLDETWDIAESPSFAAALSSSLDRSFALLAEQMGSTIFSGAVGAISKPLPSVLVQLKPTKTALVVDAATGRSAHADAASAIPEVRALMEGIFGSQAPAPDDELVL